MNSERISPFPKSEIPARAVELHAVACTDLFINRSVVACAKPGEARPD